MEKTLRIRALSVLLTLVMLIGLIPVVSTPASAVSYVETHDVDAIKTLLEQDGDISIKLNGDAKKTISSSKDDFWCVLGKGDKTLDLNGHEFRISLDDATGGSGKYNQVVTMFGVYSGTRFTLNDTSGKNTGNP